MSIRLIAAARGLAVGVLTFGLAIAGALAYSSWRSRAGCPAQHADCNAGLAALGIWSEVAWVFFFLLVAVGPLLGWLFRLPLPSRYVLPPFLTALVDVLALCAHLPWEFLLVVPLAAYPAIAVQNANRSREASSPAPSPGGSIPPR
jgi:hypothetical protein